MSRLASAAPSRTLRVLLIDSDDSFTWNLVHGLAAAGAEVDVVHRADARASPGDSAVDGVVIGPGPGAPDEGSGLPRVVAAWRGRAPLLGVCLGHQAIAVAYGARVVRATTPVHGKTSLVEHDGHGVFRGLASPARVGRYHSLVVAPESVRAPLEITARTADGEVMGLRDRGAAVETVQFHPDSFLSETGDRMFRTWLAFVSCYVSARRG